MDSSKLRKDTLAQRDLLSESRREEYSSRIMNRIVLMDQVQAASTIFTYVDFRSEVITSSLVKHMLEAGKTVVVPVTLVKDKDLLAVSITDPARELVPGYCSIPEPIMEIRKKQTVSPEIIDIIFLPGSVFDERGGRMGYGGGYYDRFVSAKAPQAIRMGLAYELQMVPQAPLQDHDELLDFIVTEERTVVGNRNKREN